MSKKENECKYMNIHEKCQKSTLKNTAKKDSVIVKIKMSELVLLYEIFFISNLSPLTFLYSFHGQPN